MLGCGLVSSDSGYWLVAGSSEHGNEISSSLKGRISCLDEHLLASQEGPCSVELID